VPEAVGEVFNIGGGSRVVLLDVLDTMAKVIGKPIEHRIKDSPGEMPGTPPPMSPKRVLFRL